MIQRASEANEMQENAFCGMGLQRLTDGESNVVPVDMRRAQPYVRYTFAPPTKFTIAAGTFQAGQSIDPSTLKQQITIDFTGKDEDVATVNLEDTGTFDNLIFSSSAQ